jgi:hypothetical protein
MSRGGTKRLRRHGSRRCCTTSMSTASAPTTGRSAPGRSGMDRVTWSTNGQNLEVNLSDLHAKVHSGA